MTNISFDEPQYRATQRRAGFSYLTAFVIRLGLARDEQKAQAVLAAIGIAAAVLAVVVYIYSSPASSDIPLPPTDI